MDSHKSPDTFQGPVGELKETTRIPVHRKRVPSSRLAVDLHSVVAGLQEEGELAQVLNDTAWVITEMGVNTRPGLEGGGISARRTYTRRAVETVMEIIADTGGDSLQLLPNAPLSEEHPASNGRLIITPVDGGGVVVVKEMPISDGCLGLIAEYGANGLITGVSAKFKSGAEHGESIELALADGVKANKITGKNIPTTEKTIELEVALDSTDRRNREFILTVVGNEPLVLRGMPQQLRQGLLLPLILAEKDRILATATIETETETETEIKTRIE